MRKATIMSIEVFHDNTLIFKLSDQLTIETREEFKQRMLNRVKILNWKMSILEFNNLQCIIDTKPYAILQQVSSILSGK